MAIFLAYPNWESFFYGRMKNVVFFFLRKVKAWYFFIRIDFWMIVASDRWKMHDFYISGRNIF